MVANQGKITNLAGTPSTGLVDGTDKLHSGILKTLESFSQGDMCISHAGFTITDAGTYTQYNLAQPIKFTSKGQYVSYTSGNLTVAYSSTVADASNDRYDWVLLNPNIGGTPAIVIVQGTAASAPLVADITAGYIPIALVKIDAGSANDATSRNFQLYTMSKLSNSLSIGHNDSGYTEAMSITSNAGEVSLENKVQDKDIIIKGNDGGVSTSIATFDVSDNKLLVPNRIETNTLLLGYSTGPARVQVYNAGDDLELYAAGSSGGNVKILELDAGTDGAEANRTATVTGNLHVSQTAGIGTDAPAAEVHVMGASAPELRLQEDGNDGYTALIAHSDNYGALVVRDNAGSQSTILDIDVDSAGTGAQTVRLFRSSNASATSTKFQILEPNTTTETFRVAADDGDTTIATTLKLSVSSQDGYIDNIIDDKDLIFRASTSSATNEIMRIDSTQQAVSIGTATSNAKLTVNGDISRKGLIRNVTIA